LYYYAVTSCFLGNIFHRRDAKIPFFFFLLRVLCTRLWRAAEKKN
jgi:hypothetical protein